MTLSATDLLGLHTAPAELTLLQMSLRAIIVVLWGIVIVRIGDGRLLGRNAGFDMLLVVILGSVLSRGVNGQSAFFATLGVSAVVVMLHHLLALAASRSDFVSRLLKGSPHRLIDHGTPDKGAMRKLHITPEDLDEKLRLNGNVRLAKDVFEARLERNGEVSVVRKS